MFLCVLFSLVPRMQLVCGLCLRDNTIPIPNRLYGHLLDPSPHLPAYPGHKPSIPYVPLFPMRSTPQCSRLTELWNLRYCTYPYGPFLSSFGNFSGPSSSRCTRTCLQVPVLISMFPLRLLCLLLRPLDTPTFSHSFAFSPLTTCSMSSTCLARSVGLQSLCLIFARSSLALPPLPHGSQVQEHQLKNIYQSPTKQSGSLQSHRVPFAVHPKFIDPSQDNCLGKPTASLRTPPP